MNTSTLCVGADVHLKEITLRAVDKRTSDEVIAPFNVANNLPGAQSAASRLAEVATRLGYTHIEIGCEATGMLWIPFHRFLSTCQLLEPFDLQQVCFNPKLVADFKDALVLRGPKDDERDAFDVAARVQVGHWPDSYVPDDFWQGLRRLTRYRFKLSQEKMRFQSYAFLKCSDWKRVKAFSDVFGAATSVALLTEFIAAELREMTHDQLADLIVCRGRGHFYDPDATARTVQQALHTSYPIDRQMDEMVTATLATGWEHVRAINRLIKRLDQQISRCIEPVPNPIITIKGLGPVITAGLLAEIVDISRFPEHKHMAQYFGISWTKRSSAGSPTQDSRMTKVGNPYGRYYFVIGADKLRQFNLEYKAYYWRKYNEVSKHQHKRALVLTARKLVRLVHALLTKNVPYVRPRTTVVLEEADLLQ
ncbi:MAG: IS110 family transposase [Chloroflexota bacterium]|nr:IS110 family transposase [Chloroflexota bacterium]